jgi:hypothetical protein
MTPATIALITQIIELLVQAAGQAPSMLSLAEQAKSLLTSTSDPTPEQEAQIRALLDAANTALQGS